MRLKRILLLSGRRIINAEWTLNFPGLLEDMSGSCLKIELFNVQSLYNKAYLIQEHIQDKDLDIMCFTETGISQRAYLISMRPVLLDINISREHGAQVVAAA